MTTYFKYLPQEVISKKIQKEDFPFSQYLFWDTPLENLDTEKHKNYITERVMSRGMLADFYYLLQLYTAEEISSAIKKSRVLDNKTINFCSIYFKIPITELNASSYYS